jgi:hypothetical protein
MLDPMNPAPPVTSARTFQTVTAICATLGLLMSTRGLIIAALLCGLAILVAFTIQVLIAS